MTRDADALTKAIAYLGAVEVAPGRYAWKRNDSDDRYFIGDERAVLNQYGPIRKGSTPGIVGYMPQWWSPEQRFAWQCFTCKRTKLTRDEDMAEHLCADGTHSHLGGRITADLETGEEVPA